MQLRTIRARTPMRAASQRSPLDSETRHSAMLLGGAIGIMGLFALLLFFGTSRLAG